MLPRYPPAGSTGGGFPAPSLPVFPPGPVPRFRIGLRFRPGSAKISAVVRPVRRLLGPLAALLAALPLLGDVIYTTDRRKYEGRVVRETEEAVTIRTYADGEITIPRSKIKKWVKRRSRFDDYEDRLKRSKPETADDHVRLGYWCARKGLKQLAEEHFRRALDLDPDHEGARRGLGMRKIDGRWVSPEEARRIEAERRAKEEALRNALGFEITLGVAEDVTEERLREMVDHFVAFNRILWRATEGNVYIKSIEATDCSTSGNVVIPEGYADKDLLPEGGRVRGNRIELAGRCYAGTFLHELGHLLFHLPHEMKNDGGLCKNCVMAGFDMEPAENDNWRYCDDENHTGPGASCLSRIKARYPKFKIPNPEAPEEPPVKPKVSIRNRGR